MTKKVNMKEMIYSVSKQLFYEQGYDATTTAQIAALSNTSKGSIAYYYETKAKLGNEIYNLSLESVKELIVKRYDELNMEYDLQIATAVELRVLTKMFLDPKIFRFYNELYSSGGFSVILEEIPTQFWELHDLKYNLNLDKGHDEIKILTTMSRGMTMTLIISFYNNNLPNATLDQIINERIRVTFELMRIPSERIEEIIKESKYIEEIFNIQYLPYFKFK